MSSNFYLRKLQLQNAPLMLEWMHDDSVVHFMGKDFSRMTLSDCVSFIRSCADESANVHRAIVSDDDVYLGTVSLKNINHERSDTEFAISLRKVAMGTGASAFAIKAIISYGFFDLGLKSVYWYVSKENIRAVKFYDKNGFTRVDSSQIVASLGIENAEEKYIWYKVSADNREKNEN